MFINRVSGIAFGSYERIDVDLSDGMFGLVGENGSGKSTFFDLILYVLFEYIRGDTLGDISNVYLKPNKNPSGTVTFTINDKKYKVERGRKLFNDDGVRLKVEKPTSFLNEIEGNGISKVIATGESVTKKIEQLMGMSFKVFINTRFFMQFNQDSFLNGRPSDRVKFLQEYYDLSIFNRALKENNERKKGVELEIDRFETKIETLKESLKMNGDIGEIKSRLDHSRKVIPTFEKNRDDLINDLESVRSINILKDKILYANQALEDLIKSSELFPNTLKNTEEKYELLNRTNWGVVVAESNKALYASENLINKQRKELSDLEAQEGLCIKNLNNLKKVENEIKCPMCLSNLKEDVINQLIQSNKDQISQLSVLMKDKNSTLLENINERDSILKNKEKARENIRECNNLKMTINGLKEEIDKNKDKINKVKDKIKDLIKERDSISDKKEIDVSFCKNKIKEIDSIISNHKANVSNCEDRIKNYNQCLSRIKEGEESIDKLNKELKIYNALTKAFDKYGTPYTITQQLIEKIEAYANAELELLSQHLEIKIDNFVSNKTSISNGIEIWVRDKYQPRRYKTFSGGEKTLVNFALRIGMSSTLQEITGAKTDSLYMDEVFGALDDKNRNNLVSVIRRLQSKFKQVAIITHTDLKDEFNEVLQFKKDNQGISRII